MNIEIVFTRERNLKRKLLLFSFDIFLARFRRHPVYRISRGANNT